MHLSRLLRIVSFTAACAAAAAFADTARAQIDTNAVHAILADYATGEVLYAKDAETPMPPSSMAKLMTLEMVFERLKDGSLKLTDMVHVSEKAWRTGLVDKESRMRVKVGSDISVDDLLRGIIVVSANDGCVVVAEALGGTEAGFAQAMNRRARELGLTNSHFVNSNGMPDPGQYMSAHDLARLTAYIIHTYPEYYSYFAIPEFTWSGIRQPNRNPLLTMNIGADGVKTGHTDSGGYGLVGSAVRGGQRLILVVNGLGSERERAEEGRRLLEIGFRDFKRYDLFGANDIVGQAVVWGGASPTVPLRLAGALSVTMHRDARRDMKVTLQYRSPVPAPVAAGQEIGTLTVSAPGKPDKTVSVYAASAVSSTGVFGHIFLGLHALFGGGEGQ